MRNPAFWLPSGNNWLSTYSSFMPNIAGLAKQYSFVFPNYFVAATMCTPSRACLLTGLYSQQTCIFQTLGSSSAPTPPALLPFNSSWTSGNGAGFPTIGNVLSQSLIGSGGYECAWIGKWHLSCLSLASGSDLIPGANGPSDYGFGSIYNLPTANTSNPYPAGQLASLGYPSPSGVLNEGSGGDFLDSFTQSPAAHDIPGFGWNSVTAPLQYNNNAVVPVAGFSQLSDAAIAYAFGHWLNYANNSNDMVYYLGGRESILDAIYDYNNNEASYPWPGVPHRRISGIPLHNNTSGSASWQLYQPFVLHTTDEFPVAVVGSNAQPGHAIALRTVDQTEVNNNAAPFFGQYTYGGGKLGVYSFWDTVGATGAPIVGIYNNSSAPAQYELYNYSPSRNNGSSNPQELGNEFYMNNGSPTALAEPYLTDFFNTGNNGGINIPDELYSLNNNGSNSNYVQQVQAAIQTAFNNYINFLECSNQMTGSNGQQVFDYGNNNGYCPVPLYSS